MFRKSNFWLLTSRIDQKTSADELSAIFSNSFVENVKSVKDYFYVNNYLLKMMVIIRSPFERQH